MAKQRTTKIAIRENYDSALEEHLPDDIEDAMLAIAYVASGKEGDFKFPQGDEMLSASQLVERCSLRGNFHSIFTGFTTRGIRVVDYGI